jgi:hypothetical protein
MLRQMQAYYSTHCAAVCGENRSCISDVTKEFRFSSSVASGPRRIEVNIEVPNLGNFRFTQFWREI